MQARGLVPNYESSIAKLFNTDMQLRMAKAGMEIMGLYGQLEPKSKWVALKGRFERQYLWQTGLAVGGGHDGDPEEHHRPARPRHAAGLEWRRRRRREARSIAHRVEGGIRRWEHSGSA